MAERLAVAVLAAGRSKRFGEADKLTVDLEGTMLGLHATAAIPKALSDHRWVISSKPDHPCVPGWSDAGFDVHDNTRAAEGMGTSVALAARLAIEAKAERLLIALADMPFVPSEHFRDLIEAESATSLTVSQLGKVHMPPAVFGSDYFDNLASLEGDKGAREILSEGTVIDCPPDWLRDIDTPDDLYRSDA